MLIIIPVPQKYCNSKMMWTDEFFFSQSAKSFKQNQTTMRWTAFLLFSNNITPLGGQLLPILYQHH